MKRIALLVFPLAVSIAAPGTFAQQTDLTIVASSIRERGYSCGKAEEMKPDPEDTVSDERTTWIVHCDSGYHRYRLTYLGDTGIEVVPLK